ncbi:helix-turn-helix transcriptional regulator [Sphingomonas glaciei]|uniref:AlpA family phage regulatory protein n=1 Tax=Sphingomonas glaciei TaxID=2938948 RepID=A0ABY5MQE8_9SPHN|nr:AlpA family phage regulatory protein [Sphingomonas glaciei]UUR06745.1 AlpA family phage regulatory protein [Sphingomonas glaciei]
MNKLPKFITTKGVAAIGHVSVATAWRYSRRPDFPKPRYFSPKYPVWIEDEVLGWYMSRPQTRVA